MGYSFPSDIGIAFSFAKVQGGTALLQPPSLNVTGVASRHCAALTQVTFVTRQALKFEIAAVELKKCHDVGKWTLELSKKFRTSETLHILEIIIFMFGRSEALEAVYQF